MELAIKIIEKEIERREILLAVEKNVLIQNDMSNEIGMLRDSVKKLTLTSVVVSEAECCDICKEESKKGNKVNKICTNCIKEHY